MFFSFLELLAAYVEQYIVDQIYLPYYLSEERDAAISYKSGILIKNVATPMGQCRDEILYIANTN